MKWRRAWVIARKDLAELRSSRFTLASVIALPIVLAVVVPLISLAPIAAITGTDQPLAEHVLVNQTDTGRHFFGVTISNASIQQSVVSNGSVFGSLIGNSTLINVFVDGSILYNDTLVHCIVRGSNLYHPTMDSDTALYGSVLVGQESALRLVLDQLLNFYLFFFVVIPVAIPSVLASYTIVGEKVNRTLEPLLASPLSDEELLVGKSVAILIPSVGATWGAFAIFSAIVVTDFDQNFGSSPVPNLTWYLTILLLTPLVCLLSIAVNVLISARVSDVRLSQQLGSLVILPLLVVFIGSFVGLFSLGPSVILTFAALLLVADVAVFFFASRTFHREEILVRWK